MSRTRLAALADTVVLARPYQRVERALLAFTTLLLPSSCVVCGAWDTSLCPGCLAGFRQSTVRPFRAEDGAESLPDVPVPELWLSPPGAPSERFHVTRHRELTAEDPPYGPLPVLTAGHYHGTVPAVLLAFKNHGHVDLLAPVSAALAGVLHEAMSEFAAHRSEAAPVVIVPVPSRGASRRKRGYDPLALLLGGLRRTGSLPAGTLLLPAVRQVPFPVRVASDLADGGAPTRLWATARTLLPGLSSGQKGLGRRRRRFQVSRSMQVVPRARATLAGAWCVIVDDVLTTGATIGEMHRVLSEHGGRVLGAVVIAATTPPGGGEAGPPLLPGAV